MKKTAVEIGIAAVLAWALLSAGAAFAADHGGRLVLPDTPLDRSGELPVVYELGQAVTGHARLRIYWTDSLDRVIADRRISSDLRNENRIVFNLDLSRAVALANHLRVDIRLDGDDEAPAPQRESAEADFVTRPAAAGWKDYVVMMWQRYPANHLPQVKKLGVNAGQYSARSDDLPAFLIDNNMRFYLESLAPAYYAEYHRYRPDHPKDWAFDQAKKQYRENPDSLAAFKRKPGFWDPAWRQRVHDRGVAAGKRYAPYAPYFYSLSDEPGIADLGAQWDFDFSEQSLSGMRRWLQSQYESLAALNGEWDTDFAAWHDVTPLTTNQAMQRPGNNFASWADFKTWMDIAFADALKMGADAIREGDPDAYVGIVGAQMPGWGGYDYARLTKAVTLLEPYDIGRNVDIIHALDPSIPILSTAFASGPWEKHRVWHELLHGNRGLIIWDASRRYVKANGKPGRRGRQASQYLKELRAGAGALVINSRLLNDRIAIHYSQPSLRTQWMLERRPDGKKWMARTPSYDRRHDDFLRARESWANLIEDEGFQHDFVSYEQMEHGELAKRGYPVLVLPQSSSLSMAEAKAIRAFIAAGGIALADSVPGIYDEHSRERRRSPLADLFARPQKPWWITDWLGLAGAPDAAVRSLGKGKAIVINANISTYLQDRLTGNEGPLHRLVENLLRKNGVRPRFAVENAAGHAVAGIDTHVFANGDVRLITLQSNPQLRVDELGPPDFRSNKRFEKPVKVHLRLPRPMYVYDTRSRKALGQKSALDLTVDPYEPSILAASDRPLPRMRVTVADRARRGSTLRLAVQATPAQADTSVFHVDVRNPQDERVLHYSGNVIATHGKGVKRIPLAVNDAAGRWSISVHNLLSGQTVTRAVEVR